MGYYASWAAAELPVDAIEWGALTHIAVAFYEPLPDGSLELSGANPAAMANLVAVAHGHGVRAIASIGGADSAPAFRRVTSAGVLDTFLVRLLALVEQAGYDGLDIDWEPLEATDTAAVVALARGLRSRHPELLLTLPLGDVNPNLAPDLTGYAAIAAEYDQLNVMSYGMAGQWDGWDSWHSGALYQQSERTPASVDLSIGAYLAAGIPAAKLGLGIGFYGLCFGPPITAPNQSLAGNELLAGDGDLGYRTIHERYLAAGTRHWDALARVPYLTFQGPQAPHGCTYISYDDEQSIGEKATYLRTRGLGGVIQWQLNEGYLPSAPVGQRNPLASAVRARFL